MDEEHQIWASKKDKQLFCGSFLFALFLIEVKGKRRFILDSAFPIFESILSAFVYYLTLKITLKTNDHFMPIKINTCCSGKMGRKRVIIMEIILGREGRWECSTVSFLKLIFCEIIDLWSTWILLYVHLLKSLLTKILFLSFKAFPSLLGAMFSLKSCCLKNLLGSTV